jgi:hypothetical protein
MLKFLVNKQCKASPTVFHTWMLCLLYQRFHIPFHGFRKGRPFNSQQAGCQPRKRKTFETAALAANKQESIGTAKLI